MNYNQAVRTLVHHAIDKTRHLGDGLCPDRVEGILTRDPRCAVCQAIDVVRNAKHPAQDHLEKVMADSDYFLNAEDTYLYDEGGMLLYYDGFLMTVDPDAWREARRYLDL